jgi:hypothetical protein
MTSTATTSKHSMASALAIGAVLTKRKSWLSASRRTEKRVDLIASVGLPVIFILIMITFILIMITDSTTDQIIHLRTNQLAPAAADGIEEIIEERRLAAMAEIERMRGKPPKPN